MPREANRDEDQAGHRLHAGRGARLFRVAAGQAAARGAAQGSAGAAAGEHQGDGPRGDAEDLAAGDPKGLRAAAGDVPVADGWCRRQEKIAVAVSLRTSRLLLRPWRDEDIAPFAEMSADAAVMEYLLPLSDRGLSIEAWVAQKRAHWEEHRFGQWVVEIPAEASFIGVVGLDTVSYTAHFTPAVE